MMEEWSGIFLADPSRPSPFGYFVGTLPIFAENGEGRGGAGK